MVTYLAVAFDEGAAAKHIKCEPAENSGHNNQWPHHQQSQCKRCHQNTARLLHGPAALRQRQSQGKQHREDKKSSAGHSGSAQHGMRGISGRVAIQNRTAPDTAGDRSSHRRQKHVETKGGKLCVRTKEEQAGGKKAENSKPRGRKQTLSALNRDRCSHGTFFLSCRLRRSYFAFNGMAGANGGAYLSLVLVLSMARYGATA